MLRLSGFAERQGAFPLSKAKFRERIVQLCRRLKLFRRRLDFSRLLGLDALLLKLLPLGEVGRGQPGAMRRGKWRAILQIDGHRAHHDAGPAVPTGPDDVCQVALKIVIDGFHSRVVPWHLLPQEHFHAVPFALFGRRLLQPLAQ